MKNLADKKKENTSLTEVVCSQSKRIQELKQENNDLLILLESYRIKETEISDTLAYAKKQADDIIKDAKLKNALEMERLLIIREKWRRLADISNPKQALERITHTLEALDECVKELTDRLNNDLPEAVIDFMNEQERLDKLPTDGARQKLTLTTEQIEELSENELEELLSQI